MGLGTLKDRNPDYFLTKRKPVTKARGFVFLFISLKGEFGFMYCSFSLLVKEFLYFNTLLDICIYRHARYVI